MSRYVRARRASIVLTVIGLLASSPQAIAMSQPAASRVMTTQQLQAESSNSQVPLQRRIDDQLKLAPAGRQISANEIAWNGGKVIMSFPLDGQRQAPDSSVTATRLMTAVTASPKKMTPSSIHGCPTVTFGADWFCLYADINWGGRRLQWSTSCTDQLSNYGFDNQTSSWVNGGALYIYVDDPSRIIWTENPHTTSSYVGDANNDRATWFTDTHSC
jgi:hypothetical protein